MPRLSRDRLRIMSVDYRNPVAADSPAGLELLERARRLSAAEDRAFRRFMEGKVRSSSGAASLRSKADEAWADVRLGIVDGASIEWAEANDDVVVPA